MARAVTALGGRQRSEAAPSPSSRDGPSVRSGSPPEPPARNLRRLYDRLTRPVPALPVDVFRVLVGLLGFVYFLGLLQESADFTNPNGLIDHSLVREMFWYTQIGLFQPWMGLAFFQAVFVLACAGCVLVVAGYRPRLVAVFLYLVAVSTYRWNFPVVYVDDGIMHLVLFWMILLPTGRTLTLGLWRANGSAAVEGWKETWVSGIAVRCFLANVALAYLVAGLWKLTSPMWREGTALYTALQMPISRAPDLWQPEFAPLLTASTYFALLFELLVPFMFILPTNHRLKWALLAAAIAFHLGIIVTMKIPYANAALMAVLVLVFGDEMMDVLSRGKRRVEPPGGLRRMNASGAIAITFVLVLTLAMIGEATVPAWRFPTRTEQSATSASGFTAASSGRGNSQQGFSGSGHNPVYAPLWLIGIAQSYRLFDWVDDRNWDIRYEVFTSGSGESRRVDPEPLFPKSTHNILLQSYMHGITWGRVPTSRTAAFRSSLMSRYSSRYCRRERPAGRVDVYALVRRINDETSDERRRARELFLRFECDGVTPRVVYPASVR